MSKYKYTIVAIFNLLVGIPEILSPIIYSVFLLPEVKKLYSNFQSMGFTTPNLPSFTFTYFMFGLIIIMGIVNLFLAIKLFSKSKEIKNKYFKFGIISAISAYILFGILLGVAYIPVITSIYNLIPPP